MYSATDSDSMHAGAWDLDGLLVAPERPSRRQPGDETVIAGLCMSRQEWMALDDGARVQLLQVLVDTARAHQGDDDYYESYELALDLP